MSTSTTKAKYPSYESYKDAGLPWVKEIPSNWNVSPNKSFLHISSNVVGEQWKHLDLLSLSKQGVIKRDLENAKGKFAADMSSYQEVKPGDLIFCLFDIEETPRTVGLSQIGGMITNAYTVFRCDKSVSRRFIEYYYIAMDDGKRLSYLYSGLRKTIAPPRFLSIRTPLPDYEVQERVSAFLDNKCSHIDTLIAKKQQLIGRLKEKRQSLITQAVTKGLNPKVEMKDSGVQWINRIPAHWTMSRSKFMFSERKEKAVDKDEQLTVSQQHGVIRQIDFMEDNNYKPMQVITGRDILKHIEAGDFVISMRSFQGGLELSEVTGCVSSAYVPLTPTSSIHAPFYKYLFKSKAYIQALQSTSNLVRDGQALRYFNFSLIPLPVVPYREQQEIADFVERKTLLVDKTIRLLEEQIKKIREHKSALIYNAVTGKIKI